MRELTAKLICLFALAVVTALTWLFAVRHNPSSPSTPRPQEMTAASQTSLPPEPPAGPASESQETSFNIFRAQGCASCHSLAGTGNPRSPLDGAGQRLSREEFRDWITGSGSASNELSAFIIKRKERYRTLPESDMNALVELLSNSDTNGAQARP